MSEKLQQRSFILRFLLAAIIGILTTALCIAGLAALMAAQGYSAGLSGVFATLAVCLGSLCSGLTAAHLAPDHRLLYGSMQGAFLAVLLAILAGFSGTIPEAGQLLRLAAVTLCGGAGGILGMFPRRHRYP